VIVFDVGSVIVFAEPRPYFTEPSLSPDRKEIAFVSAAIFGPCRDWRRRVVARVASANEARPLYSPDGAARFHLVAHGNGDIYL
jgi:hypothetical protein